MSLLDWLRSFWHCRFCRDPIAVKESLEDLCVPGPPHCYLLRCPKCGGYFGGYGFEPHFLYKLSLNEVARDFPEALHLKEPRTK